MKTEQMQEAEAIALLRPHAFSHVCSTGKTDAVVPVAAAKQIIMGLLATRQPDPRVTAMIDEVFAEDVVAQANRLDVHSRGTESPGQWMMRVRKAALLATFKSEPSS